MRCADAIMLALGLLVAGGCATTVYSFRPDDDRVVVAVQGPVRDLGIMRTVPPEILTRAAEDPYALPPDVDCKAVLSEIAALDQVLGPDLRMPGEDEEINAEGLVADVIDGAISLPYSSIVRQLTGAAQRDRKLRGAIFAGMVRRSFLRGIVLAGGCPLGIDDTLEASAPIEANPAAALNPSLGD